MNQTVQLCLLLQMHHINASSEAYARQYQSLREDLAADNPNIAELQARFDEVSKSEASDIKNKLVTVNDEVNEVKRKLLNFHAPETTPKLLETLTRFQIQVQDGISEAADG